MTKGHNMNDESWWSKIPPSPDDLPPFKQPKSIIETVMDRAIREVNHLNPFHKNEDDE